MAVGRNQKTPGALATALEAPNPPIPHPPPFEPQDIEMEISTSPLLVESDLDAPIRTRAQGRKRGADKQPENRAKPTFRSAKKTVNDPKEDAESHTTAHPSSTSTKKAISTAQQVEGTETPQITASAKVLYKMQ